MIKTFIYNLLFLFMANLLTAQPLEKNVPFALQQPGTAIDKPASLSMEDFRYRAQNQSPAGPLEVLQTKPGFALLGSAIVPGLGQVANNKWIRAGAYFVADALFLAMHFHNQQRAEKLQDNYEQFADNNWSVVTYAKWLVDYHDQNGIANPHIDNLRQQVEGKSASYEPHTDWNAVDISLLRKVEENTPFISSDGSTGNNFSHVMPRYGSQQYYELISKYYQYGPGWNNFGIDQQAQPLDSIYQLAWNGNDMPPHFYQGATMAERFNNKYRVAGNMLAYMILNHVVSAFDAFITVKLKNNRLETQTSIFGPRQINLKYHF